MWPCVWPCVAVCGRVWPCVAVCGRVWPCVAVCVAVCVCVWHPTPRMADVTVTKIAGYVRVQILMNQRFVRIFGVHTF